MLTPKLFFALIVFSLLLSCPFDDNRKIEKILAESEIKFHDLYNQGKFQEIYNNSDAELKNKFTEQQFVSYLEIFRSDTGEIELKPHVWIDDELKDGIKRLLFRRIDFLTFELVHTDKAIYREKFDWKLRGEEAKLVSFQIEKICNKPCHLAISADKIK